MAEGSKNHEDMLSVSGVSKSKGEIMKRLILLSAALALAGCGDYGDGEKVGNIVKVSHQGFTCPTWEAQIIRGGLNNGSGASGQAFEFTIEDARLIPALQDALEKQYEVKIKYHMEYSTLCRSDSDSHFLTSIERLQSPGHPLETATDAEIERRRKVQQQIEDLQRQLR